MVTSSFMGMIMALPLVFALNSSASRLDSYQAQPAVQNQSTAQVTQADFAKYMYAYDQGYQAHTASVPTGNTTTPSPDTCSCTPGSGSTNTPLAPVAMTTASRMPVKPHAPLASVVNSYNSFVSTVNNSSSVTNTNSNNTAGSNNVTKTTISAEEVKGVMINNSQTTNQVAAVDSFNKDSYNTKTDTTTISDSFNKQVAIDSGNNSGNTTTTTDTTNVNNNVTKTIDSNNTTTVTKDSNNTSNSTDTTTNTTTDTSSVTNNVNKTIDSNNTSVDVNLGNGSQGGQHSHSA